MPQSHSHHPRLVKRKDSPYFYIESYIEGRRRFFSTQTTDLTAARKFLQGLTGDQPTRNPTWNSNLFSEASKTFLQLKSGQLRESSLSRSYEPSFTLWLRIIGDRPIQDYSGLDIEKYVHARIQTVSPNSVNSNLRVLKSFGNWLVTLPQNSDPGGILLKDHRREGHGYGQEEVWAGTDCRDVA